LRSSVPRGGAGKSYRTTRCIVPYEPQTSTFEDPSALRFGGPLPIGDARDSGCMAWPLETFDASEGDRPDSFGAAPSVEWTPIRVGGAEDIHGSLWKVPGSWAASEPLRSSPAEKETAWVRAALSGDQESLTDLLNWTRAIALRQAMVRVRDAEDIEDVAQEVSLRVLVGLPSFRFRSRFSSWVHRITENEIHNLFRRRSRIERSERSACLLQVLST
jgi:hypothetical protein